MLEKMEKPPEKNTGEKIEILYDELKRKDRIIEELKKENTILMKTALKRAEKDTEKNNIIEKK